MLRVVAFIFCLIASAAQAQVTPGTSPLSIAKGGTAASTAATAFANIVQPGVDTNVLNTVTANYPIATTDCGKTVQAGTGSTGQFTVTLPAVSGFAANCTVTVKNGDTYPAGRGKLLSGFPADLNSVLYPLQSLTVKIVNGAWATTINPGRWKNPTTVTWHVDITGSDSNDGLAAGAGNALADAQTANTRAVYQSDTQGTTPIIAMACSQTHTVALNMGGTLLGNNLLQVSPDGNCAFTWTNAGPCIAVGDLAELNINLLAFGSSGGATFGCNTADATSSGNILLHNTVVLDLEGTPVWKPGGPNDNFLFCDGPCEYTIANGVTQATAVTGNYIINMSQGGKGTQSGTISASASGSLTGIYFLYDALLSLGTPNGTGWASIGTSKVYGHATLINNGISPTGGIALDPSGVNCVSLTAACASQSASTGVANAGSPTGNSTIAAKMMGLGSTCAITPLQSGKVLISFNFTHANAAVTTDTLQTMRGTGTAPANGVASTGTAVGNARLLFEPSGTANMQHSLSYLVTGLTVGTAEWFDFALTSGSNTNSATVAAVDCSLQEVP